MKRFGLVLLSLIILGSVLLPAAAQDRPQRAGEPPGDRGPGPGFGGPDGRPDAPGDMGPPGPRRPMGPEMQRYELMRSYIDVVDRFSRLSRDPTSAGVAAVISAADLLKPRGADAGIEYFSRMLESAKSDAVKRAIRIQLIDLYKQSGQQDKALEQLTELINSAPAGGGEQPGR